MCRKLSAAEQIKPDCCRTPAVVSIFTDSAACVLSFYHSTPLHLSRSSCAILTQIVKFLTVKYGTREVLTRLTGRCYCLLCAFLWIFADICLFECCVSYCCVRHGMDDILVSLLCIDATGIQSNMRVFVSTFDC